MPTEDFSHGQREEALVRFAGDVIVELRPDGRITYISPAVERILGRPTSHYIGLSFLEVIFPEDRPALIAGFRKVVETGDEPLLRYRCFHREGHLIEFESSLRTFVDDEGRQRIVAVGRDRTEQSLRSAVDRTRDTYHRAIAESGIRPVAVTKKDGEILFSNRRFREIFGRVSNLDEIRERMSEDSRLAMDSAWYRADHDKGWTPGACDFEYHSSDGSTSWFSASWESIRDGGSSSSFAIHYQDITRRKNIEQALRVIASGISGTDENSFQPILAMIAEALEMDRIVLGVLEGNDSGRLKILVGLQDGQVMEDERLSLEGLPDFDVASGEIAIHPSSLGTLIPAIIERLGQHFESYAGFPLRHIDGSVFGIVGGYGRKPIQDTDLIRSLLSSFATHAAAAIDRQRADAEIRANQARFDALALNTIEMLVEVDSDARVTYMSPASISVLGREPKSFLGLDLSDVFHPDDLRLAEESFDEILSGKLHTTLVARIQHADGSWRWIESRSHSFKAVDGTLRLLILARDFTERRRGELGRDLLFRVVQNGADLVFVCEANSKILFASDAATRLVTGPLNAGVEGQRFADLLTEKEASRLDAEILPNLATARPWSGELELRGPPGVSPIATEATIFWFEGNEDTPGTYLAITLRDITQRRSAEDALRESELRLGQAQKMEAVGRLAGGIAHDFNNLLTAIIGYSELVLDQLGDGHGSRRDAEEILRAAERAGGLTRQLLAFSRRQLLQPESIDLNVVVADIDRMMRRLVGEHIELTTIQDGELDRIIADPGQIEQVIVNLVVNARDALPKGGSIELETVNYRTLRPMDTASGELAAGDYVLLKVSDTGIGMNDAIQTQIFEPFFTTKQAHEGTGLGLASAYGIVSQSGGQIDVESAPGRGTTFSIYLPAVLEEVEEVDRVAQATNAIGNETILVVEDSAPVRQLVARTLEKSGYTVLIAESATAALRHCSRHPGSIDLLLTDVVLPKTSGPEIARRAVQLRPQLRVLFMSGFTDDTLTRHGLDEGTSMLLEKPFSPTAVLSRIRQQLDRDPAHELDSEFHVEQTK